MLAGDERSAWPRAMFDDSRVTNVWDGNRIAGKWFAQHETGGLGGPGSIVWDAYLAYGPGVRWESLPTEPVVAGSDIIANTDRLRSRFIPMLG
jgi:hypothetical protein